MRPCLGHVSHKEVPAKWHVDRVNTHPNAVQARATLELMLRKEIAEGQKAVKELR